MDNFHALIDDGEASVALFWRTVGKSGDSIKEWEKYTDSEVCQLPPVFLNCSKYKARKAINGSSNLKVQFGLRVFGKTDILVLSPDDVEWIFSKHGHPECRKKLDNKSAYNPVSVLELM